MTEERLKEIKDSVDFQLSVCDIPGYEYSKLLAEEELELYNEVVRLRERIKKIEDKLKFINQYFSENNEIQFMQLINNQHEILDRLEQNNLTLEQINGIDN